jgi:magnesium-transporting ATPase (P-type)
MNTNSFTKNMRLKSNKELETILKKKNDYTQEAIQAVIWEMENRNLIDKSDVLYKNTFKENNQIDTDEKNLDNNENPSKELILPVLYSKRAIQGFTIFFTTIFGAVLLMYNLKEMNKLKERNQVLIFGIVFTILSAILLNYLPKMIFTTLLFNLIGYAVLIEFFWKNNIEKELEYAKKEVWKPLTISIIILLLLLFLQLLPQILGM